MGISKEFEEILQFWKNIFPLYLRRVPFVRILCKALQNPAFLQYPPSFISYFCARFSRWLNIFRRNLEQRRFSEDFRQSYSSCKGSHPQAMQRSVGQLSGIASLFLRGFRSSAFAAMPIKVKVFFSFPQFVVGLMSIARSTSCYWIMCLYFKASLFH